MGNRSRFVRPGYCRVQVYGSLDAIRGSAFISPDNNNLTIVIVNSDDDDHVVPVAIEDGLIASLTPWETSSVRSLEALSAITPSADGSFLLEVSARSVTTFVGEKLSSCQQVQNLGYRLEADLNGDCLIDLSDLMLLTDQWLSTSPQAVAPNYSPDLVVDGNINFADFAVMAEQWLVCNDPEAAGSIVNW